MFGEETIRHSGHTKLYLQPSAGVVVLLLWGCFAASATGAVQKVDRILTKDDCLQIVGTAESG